MPCSAVTTLRLLIPNNILTRGPTHNVASPRKKRGEMRKPSKDIISGLMLVLHPILGGPQEHAFTPLSLCDLRLRAAQEEVKFLDSSSLLCREGSNSNGPKAASEASYRYGHKTQAHRSWRMGAQIAERGREGVWAERLQYPRLLSIRLLELNYQMQNMRSKEERLTCPR